MKICFCISTLSTGGAERVAVTLMNEWVEKGHEVSCVTFEALDQKPSYPLHENITVHRLDILGESQNMFHFVHQTFDRLRKIRSHLKEQDYDAILSFMTQTNILVLLASFGLGLPVFVSERIHPQYHRVGLKDNIARRFFYRLAKSVIVQTKDIQAWVKINLGLKAVILANPILIPEREVVRPKNLSLIAVGRLDAQKGYDVLIKAFHNITLQYSDLKLNIYGTGLLKAQLEEQIKSLKLTDQITLCGATDDIFGALLENDIFVHCARYEGFPNVVLEAMAAGCSVVSTDGPTGVSDLLGANECGIVVPNGDTKQISAAIVSLIENDDLRKCYSDRARKVAHTYDVGSIADEWIKHFKSIN